MSANLTVALLQVEAAGYDQDENLRRGEAACRRAASLAADVALFPEMWNIGYGFELGEPPTEPPLSPGVAPEAALERWRGQAIARDGPFVAQFAVSPPSWSWPSPSRTSRSGRTRRATR